MLILIHWNDPYTDNSILLIYIYDTVSSIPGWIYIKLKLFSGLCLKIKKKMTWFDFPSVDQSILPWDQLLDLQDSQVVRFDTFGDFYSFLKHVLMLMSHSWTSQTRDVKSKILRLNKIFIFGHYSRHIRVVFWLQWH